MSLPSGPGESEEISFLSRHSDLVWTDIGREEDGVDLQDVQQSLALRPPHHVISFVGLAPGATKGITNTGLSTLFYVVMAGEVNFVINHRLLVARKGDNFYVPPNYSFSLMNLTEERVELFLFQHKYVSIKQ